MRYLSVLDAAAVLVELARIALEPGLAANERGGRNPADDYIQLGFVSSESGRSVSTQLEYAVDDFALANLSAVLGNDEFTAVFGDRQYSYRELFDPATQTFRPRDRDGEFPSAEGYDPGDFGDEFAEANAMQMLWAPIHDARGLAERLDEMFIATLSEFFESAASDLVANPLDELIANAVPRPHYWHGNEPDIHAAYLFGQRGRDDLTQRWLTWIRQQLYADTSSGLAGNDDSGTLSSWYVWSAMGIYPVAGSDRYFVGLPLFPKMTIQTRQGTLVIEAPSDGPIAGVSGLTVNGERVERAEVRHADLVGTIRFDVTNAPTRWSTAD